MAASRSTSRSGSPTVDARRIALSLLACALACGGSQRGEPDEVADLVLVGGRVTTLDPARPSASAIAIRDGRIAAVGGDAEVRELVGGATRVIELRGRAVTPGLTDAHAHLYNLGASVEQIALRGATSEADAVARVVAGAAAVPAGAWVVGRGWDQNLWKSNQFPDRASLDRALGDRPVALRRIDGHALWVSSAALAAAGIDGKTADPPGGRIVREGGKPTGVLIDNAMALVESKIPPATGEARARRILAAAHRAVASGLTSVHEMGIDDATADTYRSLADEGRLPIRVYAYLDGTDPALAERLAGRIADRDRSGASMFVLRGIKLFADGALGSRGARLTAPYSDAPGQLGLWVTEPPALGRAVEAATAAGFQVAIHAIGDAGTSAALDACAAAGVPGSKARYRVEHAQVVAAEDRRRFAELGVIASMQPTHATSDMGWAEARLGPERIKGAYAWRTLRAAGARLVFGSDFPIEEVSPLLGLHAAVTGQLPSGQPPGGFHPEELVTLDQALAAYTTDAAYAAFAEGERGRIAPGMVADLTVFDRPLAVATLLSTRVEATVVGGRVVYERK